MTYETAFSSIITQAYWLAGKKTRSSCFSVPLSARNESYSTMNQRRKANSTTYLYGTVALKQPRPQRRQERVANLNQLTIKTTVFHTFGACFIFVSFSSNPRLKMTCSKVFIGSLRKAENSDDVFWSVSPLSCNTLSIFQSLFVVYQRIKLVKGDWRVEWKKNEKKKP